VAELTSVTAAPISVAVTVMLMLPPVFCSTGGLALSDLRADAAGVNARHDHPGRLSAGPSIKWIRQLRRRERRRHIAIARAGESIIRCGVSYRF
jgi:hypothetical protein